MIAAAPPPIVAHLRVWSGTQLPGSVPYARKYAIAIDGRPGTSVRLRSVGLPSRWVGSFCTARICALSRVVIQIPASGRSMTEFQVVPDDRMRGQTREIQVAVNSSTMTFTLRRTSKPSDAK